MNLICLHRKGDLDSFMELTKLVHKGEKKGIFMDEMSASIHQIIQAENLTFVKNRRLQRRLLQIHQGPGGC